MSEQARNALISEAQKLSVDEILGLCYAMGANPDRLRLYGDVLRKRGGQRAQFASCLVCFDLARQGDPPAQREFAYLADMIRQLGQDTQMVDSLVGSDPYLSFLWEMCEAQLEELDTRFAPGSISEEPIAEEEVAEFDLLSDDDFDDFDILVDNEALVRQFEEALEKFLGGTIGVPMFDPNSGFRMKNSRDAKRVEDFMNALDSLRDIVPLARGYRALVLLFYGTHLRSRSLFGAVNQRKNDILRAGIFEYLGNPQEVWNIAGVLNPLHATPKVLAKICDVILDYARWRGEGHADPLEAYSPVQRMLDREAAA